MAPCPKRLMENKYILYALRNAKPKLRSAIIKNCGNEVINTLSEISLNVLKGNVANSTKTKNKLKKYKKQLRCLSCSKRGVNSKRNILIQRGGLLPALLGAVLSAIVGKMLS